MADQTHVRDEFEFEFQMAFATRLPGLCMLGRSVCRGGKTRIAAAPAAAFEQNDALVGIGQIREEVTGFRIFDESANGHGNFSVIAPAAGPLLARSARTMLCAQMLLIPIIEQCGKARIRDENDIATIATIATVWPSVRHVLFPAKTLAPIPAIAGTAVDFGEIDEHKKQPRMNADTRRGQGQDEDWLLTAWNYVLPSCIFGRARDIAPLLNWLSPVVPLLCL